MNKGTIVLHHAKGYGFIQAEGFPGNVFVTPKMMAELARELDIDNLVDRQVHFEATEVDRDGKMNWQATSLSPISNTKTTDTELVENVLAALRPAIQLMIDAMRK